MFGSATPWLALLGCCSIIFWIICWLVIPARNEEHPRLAGLSSVIATLLAFITAVPSALFAIPIVLNYKNTIDKVSREEYQKGLNASFSESSSQLKKAHDAGYKEAVARYEKIIKTDREKANEMYLNYCDLYFKCKSDPRLSEMMSNIPSPRGYNQYLKYRAEHNRQEEK